MSKYLSEHSSSERSTTSGGDSSEGNDSETFLKKIFKKRKLPKPTLKRSSRQGMCLLSTDDKESEPEEEKKQIRKTLKT